MTWKVELIPISEGNRITVKENEKIIVGRGSSLGCNDKKISRQHGELLLKTDKTLWIKPTHTNPIFYRPSTGKTSPLTKDSEQELKDGDQIGLLPTSFFFRVSFSTDMNNNKDELNADNHNDVKSKSCVQDASVPTASSVKDQNESESTNSDSKSRKLPTWMATSTSSGPLNSSSSSDHPTVKRQLSSEENNNQSSTTPDTSATVPIKSTVTKSFDSDSEETFDSISPKKLKSSDKPRPVCQYGASCYRKNPTHRTEQSHPGDSDYEDEKKTKDNDADANKPQCPYGKTCYRQNPEHKRDYKH